MPEGRLAIAYALCRCVGHPAQEQAGPIALALAEEDLAPFEEAGTSTMIHWPDFRITYVSSGRLALWFARLGGALARLVPGLAVHHLAKEAPLAGFGASLAR